MWQEVGLNHGCVELQIHLKLKVPTRGQQMSDMTRVGATTLKSSDEPHLLKMNVTCVTPCGGMSIVLEIHEPRVS